ncbi:MAG: hypothetical protein V4736_10610 [Bdellovibrionota bacterium]
MKTQNETNKTTQTLALALVILAFAFGSTAKADANCGLQNPSVLKDTETFADMLVSHYSDKAPKLQNVSFTSKSAAPALDNKYLKIDRSLNYLNQLDSVGIMTSSPFQNAPISSASAILVSPCHVLSVRHGMPQVGSKMFFSVGQNSCDSKDQFKNMNAEATLVMKGFSRTERGLAPNSIKDDQLQSDDLSVFKIKPIHNVKPAKISTYNLMSGELAMTVGFPDEAILANPTSPYRNSYGVFAKTIGLTPFGTHQLSNTKDAPGLSGAGVFVMDEDDSGKPAPLLTGMNYGGGEMISMDKILSRIKERDQQLHREILEAQSTGICK